jgi:hypothetical protein
MVSYARSFQTLYIIICIFSVKLSTTSVLRTILLLDLFFFIVASEIEASKQLCPPYRPTIPR